MECQEDLVEPFLFVPKDMETVEEIYLYHFNEAGKCLSVSFLDTAGNISFPAMRQLYISKAQAFVLVYSIKDENSFLEVKKKSNFWFFTHFCQCTKFICYNYSCQ
jgi:hypothetical protein